MNRAIISTNIEIVMKKLQLTNLKPDGFTWKYYEPVRELLAHALLKHFQNSRVGGNPKLILQGHHHTDTNTEVTQKKKVTDQYQIDEQTFLAKYEQIKQKKSTNTLKGLNTIIKCGVYSRY